MNEPQRIDLTRAIAESDIAGCELTNRDVDSLVEMFESWLERQIIPDVEEIAEIAAHKIVYSHEFQNVPAVKAIIASVLTGCEPWRLGVEQAAKVGYQVVTDHAEGNKIQVSVLAHKVQEACRALLPDGVGATDEVSQALAELREIFPDHAHYRGFVVSVADSGEKRYGITVLTPTGVCVSGETLAEAMAAVRASLPVQIQEEK